jgi:hypothetical protein
MATMSRALSASAEKKLRRHDDVEAERHWM